MNYYYVFVVLFLVSLTLRSTYEVLKEMRKIDPENKIIFGIIFSVMMMLWASVRWIHSAWTFRKQCDGAGWGCWSPE
jgi:hypothetical protein